MKRFVEGEDRLQIVLLPHCLDDYVTENNPVRVIEAFADELDLTTLGFEGVVPEATGRPAYHPATLLKIYVYGYLNRVQSSRRLERETQRNIEVMWLTGRLTPDFKTIADFRKNNGPAIRATCRQFVMLCRQLDLFSEAVVAVDGSKFKAVNNRDKNFTPNKIQRRMEQIETSIDRYLSALDAADRQEGEVAQAKAVRLKDKIAVLKQQMQQFKQMEVAVRTAPDQQISLTDPDARSMATSGKGTGIVGYNVQTAVDVEHHLIVAHEVTNVGHDRTQLVPMALRAQEAMGNEEITVLADRGYFNGDQVLACENTGVLPCVPKTLTSSSAKRGLFTRQDFIYDAEKDHYTCPARRAPDERVCPIGPPRRRRPIPPSDRLLHLSSQAQVYAGQAKADQALEARRCPRRNASQARSDARCHGGAPANCGAPFRNLQIVDGKHALPDQDAEAGPHRDEPPRSGLQHEAGDRDHRCRTAAAGDPGLSA
jgi:transposase